ncbi:MAG: SDR family NAD(P)-dependent oxidoreductase [Dehalococcoidia bacterium]
MKQRKTALVTGASSGLGRDMARELARRGCNLVLVARREERLLALKAELEPEHGISVHVIPIDLGKDGAGEHIEEQVQAAGLDIDILINNAGYGLKGDFLEVPWEQQRDLIQVDVLAAGELTRRFLPGMVERDSGRVMFVASTMAYQAAPGFATYSAAKGFVLLLGEALAYELRNTNVRVTVVSPGRAATEFHDRMKHPPGWWLRATTMSSEEVARRSINAMLKGKPSVILGAANYAMINSGRFAPRRLTTAISNFFARPGSAQA